MTDYNQVDFFTDPALVADPFPYFEHLRAIGPIVPLPGRNVVGVTGFQETVDIITDNENFSSANSPTGPIPELPFEPLGDDISEQLNANRHLMVATGMVVAKDGEDHHRHRSLLYRLFTPSRLKENEQFFQSLAHKLLQAVVESGSMELIGDFATPFATLTIADLLGVPAADRDTFCEKLGGAPGKIGEEVDYEHTQALGMGFLFEYFTAYITERREHQRSDIMSDFAAATFPDATTPTIEDLVWLAAFLFGAGRDTTARLLGTAVKVLCEQPQLQDRLRNDRELLPAFIEEAIRYDGPVKCANRLAVRTTTIGDTVIHAGTTVSLFYGAANRDPRQFDHPDCFDLERTESKRHLGFGRGVHTCIGMPLARAEVRACLNRILDQLQNIRFCEEEHGPAADRRFSYEAVYSLRALKALHIQFDKTA